MSDNSVVMLSPVARDRGSRLLALWKIVRAEMLKQHRILFGSKMMYFSMLVWPALELASAYFTFRPFLHAPDLARNWSVAADPSSVALFFITGLLGYTFFRSIVQASWQFSFERFHGTLEILFLSPANRLVLILANGAGGLVQSVWLFLTFSLGLILLVGGLHMASPAMIIVAFLGLLIPSLGWAAFLNSLCIFARDSGFVYTVIESTMSFFAGVRIPLPAFPFWVRAVGLLFPLTTSLVILRGALLSNETLQTLWPQLLFLGGFTLLMLLTAMLILKKGEEHAREHGTLTLF
jgi:ABC-2 type transport system permease protein